MRPDQDQRLIDMGSSNETCEKCMLEFYPGGSDEICKGCGLSPMKTEEDKKKFIANECNEPRSVAELLERHEKMNPERK